jgi:hypothetical protein
LRPVCKALTSTNGILTVAKPPEKRKVAGSIPALATSEAISASVQPIHQDRGLRSVTRRRPLHCSRVTYRPPPTNKIRLDQHDTGSVRTSEDDGPMPGLFGPQSTPRKRATPGATPPTDALGNRRYLAVITMVSIFS